MKDPFFTKNVVALNILCSAGRVNQKKPFKINDFPIDIMRALCLRFIIISAMEKDFKRDISVLDAVFEFVDDFLSAQNAGERISYSIRLVVEELFINFIKHNVKRPAISQKVTEKKDTNQRERKAGADGKNNIFISLQRDAGVLRVRLTDYGVNPVSIPGKERTNITLPLQERQVGGLGIHLVRSLVDTLTYEYKDGNLSVTATKSMENKDV